MLYDVIQGVIQPHILARMKVALSNGWAMPSYRCLYAESEFLRDISTEITKFDLLFNFMHDASTINYGLKNIFTNSFWTLTQPGGAVTHNPKQGISNGGFNSLYLSLGVSVSNYSIQAQQDNASMGVFIHTATGAEATFNICGGSHSSASGQRIQRTATTVPLRINADTNSNFGCDTIEDNTLIVGQRNAYNNQSLYKNGVLIGNSAILSTGEWAQSQIFILNCRQSGAPEYGVGCPSTFKIGGFYWGSGTIDHLKMYNAYKKMSENLALYV